MNEKRGSGLGIAGMILGIISVILSFLVVGGIIGIIGIILSIVAMAKKGAKKGAAIAGFVLNLIAIIIMIAVISIAGSIATGLDSYTNGESEPAEISDDNSAGKEKTFSKKKEGKTDEGEGKADEEKEGEPEEVKTEFSVGDVIGNKELKISYLSAEEYFPDNQFLNPEEGNVIYKMDFEFENISDSDQTISSFDFDCYADGYDMERRYIDGLDLDATISPGKKTKGAVFFEVPSDSQEIILEYETNYWTEEKITFIVK